MALAVPDLVAKGNSIIFTGEVLDIYIPKTNMNSGLAEYNGEYIHTMGIFLFEVKTFDEANNSKHTRIYSMKLPLFIDFQYSNSFKYTGKLGDYPSDEYEVFRLEAGNKFIANTTLTKDDNNAVVYIQALHKGHLPKMLDYNDIILLYHQVLSITGVNLKAPSLIYELTVSEVVRSSNNIKQPFRNYINRTPNGSLHNYATTNINRLAMLNSTFAGLTFENVNDAIATSIERTQNNDNEQETPMEKLAKM